MTPHELMGLALEVAQEGLAAGEQPIGAVVVAGDTVLGRAYTQEKTRRRRIVHADLLALLQADEVLGFKRPSAPLVMAVTLEPCLMCLGTAMTLGVTAVYFGLHSPSDGAAGIADVWQPANPDMPFSQVPKLTGGIRRDECKDLFVGYCATAPESAMRTWALSLIS